MGFFKSLLVVLVPTFALVFAAINGLLGENAQHTAENIILNILGESRGSYFLKSELHALGSKLTQPRLIILII